MKSFFNNRDQHISGQRNPNLCLDRVLACAVKRLDFEMLRDPLDELHLQRLLYKAAIVAAGKSMLFVKNVMRLPLGLDALQGTTDPVS